MSSPQVDAATSSSLAAQKEAAIDSSPSSAGDAALADNLASLQVQDQTSSATPPHLSHDPQNNMKRSDPFQFGSRLLSEEQNVYEFNAWDHVETDDTYKEYAELQYAKQRESPVSDFDKCTYSIVFFSSSLHPDDSKMHSSSEASAHERNKFSNVFRSYLICNISLTSLINCVRAQANKLEARFNGDPAKWWNNFYKNNTSNFFKDRKWLQQEFPVLSKVVKADAGPITLLEVGAGAGNTAFPILAHNQNPSLKIHACDFSKKAVEVIRENEAYDTKYIQADVWDAASDELPPGLEESSCDVVLMIFIFSALSPIQWKQAVHNIYRVLKPGGELLFRDYGRGDLAQVRFKKGRYLEENFYIRGDGTRVYFFEKDELVKIWTGQDDDESKEFGSTGFKVIDLGVDRRLLVNRAKQLKMYRCWMQGRFRKEGRSGIE